MCGEGFFALLPSWIKHIWSLKTNDDVSLLLISLYMFISNKHQHQSFKPIQMSVWSTCSYLYACHSLSFFAALQYLKVVTICCLHALNTHTCYLQQPLGFFPHSEVKARRRHHSRKGIFRGACCCTVPTRHEPMKHAGVLFNPPGVWEIYCGFTLQDFMLFFHLLHLTLGWGFPPNVQPGSWRRQNNSVHHANHIYMQLVFVSHAATTAFNYNGVSADIFISFNQEPHLSLTLSVFRVQTN